MSRQGLIEKNAVTKEEIRISAKEQNFNLRKESDKTEISISTRQREPPKNENNKQKRTRQKRLQREIQRTERISEEKIDTDIFGNNIEFNSLAIFDEKYNSHTENSVSDGIVPSMYNRRNNTVYNGRNNTVEDLEIPPFLCKENISHQKNMKLQEEVSHFESPTEIQDNKISKFQHGNRYKQRFAEQKNITQSEKNHLRAEANPPEEGPQEERPQKEKTSMKLQEKSLRQQKFAEAKEKPPPKAQKRSSSRKHPVATIKNKLEESREVLPQQQELALADEVLSSQSITVLAEELSSKLSKESKLREKSVRHQQFAEQKNAVVPNKNVQKKKKGKSQKQKFVNRNNGGIRNEQKNLQSDTVKSEILSDAKTVPPPENTKLKFSTEELETESPEFAESKFAESSVTSKSISTTSKTEKKISKLEKKSEKVTASLKRAKDNLPTKRKLQMERTFDESKQKGKYRLKFEKEVLPQHAEASKFGNATKTALNHAKFAVINKAHQKMSEVEQENVGVKAVHQTEQSIENIFSSKSVTRSAYRFAKNSSYRKVEKLERNVSKINFKRDYQTALNNNPKLQKNIISRLMQKRRIKKQYANATKKALETGKSLQKTGLTATKVINFLSLLIRRNPKVVAIIIAVTLVIILFSSLMMALSSLFSSGGSLIYATSYLADDSQIDRTSLAYTEWETDLLFQIQNTENSHSGHDEYRYNIGDISHNPYELMAFLTAKFQRFTYENVETELRSIFNEQYTLTFTPSVETRYYPDSDETYDWHVLTVNLTSRSLTEIIFARMTNEERQMYNIYMQTKGNRQYMDSPFDFNWLIHVSSNYGYRIHPITGEKDYHKGIDIAVPVGTDIRAGHDGIVSVATYDSGYGYYIVIDGENGLQSKYAHCEVLLASVGQTVKTGDVIAKSGNSGSSTGSHLHLEILKNGEYLNPLFFVVTNAIGYVPIYGDAGSPMGDGGLSALIAEAERHLGKPYIK